jgi:multicomponent Na+:H+ antiporter subunit G
MSELIGYSIIGVGVAFDLFGALGLVRLPDVYNRLQAATKCVTLGTCMILIGVAVCAGSGPMVSRAIICTVFLLLTSPVGAHALARGAHLGGVKLWGRSIVDRYEQDAERVARAMAQPEKGPGKEQPTA